MMRRRLVLFAAMSVAAAMVLLTAGLFLVLSHRLEQDADAVLRSRAQATLATLGGSGNRLHVSEGPLDKTIDDSAWVFDASGQTVARPRGGPALDREVQALSGVTHATYRNARGDVRLFALPAVSSGNRLGTVVVSVSLVPYEHSERIALIAALLLDVLVVALVGVVTHRVVTAALRPVAHMTEQALDWSEHEIDRRFALGAPRDELTKLAHALDVLLGRLGANMRRERRLSAEIAHQLKTPLTRIRGEAELALRRRRTSAELRDALTAVMGETDRLAHAVDTLLAVSQREIDPTEHVCHAGEVASEAVTVALTQAEGVELDYRPPEPDIRVGCDAETLRQMLGPLLNNATKYGRHRVELAIVERSGSICFIVCDDGPGVASDEAEAIFEPGVRGGLGDGNVGSGLGLTLSRRLARAAGGDVTAVAGRCGRFELRLPLA